MRSRTASIATQPEACRGAWPTPIPRSASATPPSSRRSLIDHGARQHGTGARRRLRSLPLSPLAAGNGSPAGSFGCWFKEKKRSAEQSRIGRFTLQEHQHPPHRQHRAPRAWRSCGSESAADGRALRDRSAAGAHRGRSKRQEGLRQGLRFSGRAKFSRDCPKIALLHSCRTVASTGRRRCAAHTGAISRSASRHWFDPEPHAGPLPVSGDRCWPRSEGR
jgi:hypothetical protein